MLDNQQQYIIGHTLPRFSFFFTISIILNRAGEATCPRCWRLPSVDGCDWAVCCHFPSFSMEAPIFQQYGLILQQSTTKTAPKSSFFLVIAAPTLPSFFRPAIPPPYCNRISAIKPHKNKSKPQTTYFSHSVLLLARTSHGEGLQATRCSFLTLQSFLLAGLY